MELLAAIAAHRAEHIAGEALGVHAHGHVGAVPDVSLDERHVVEVVDEAVVAHGLELTVGGGQAGFHISVNSGRVVALPLHELLDGDQGEPVLVREAAQLRQPGHFRGVILADDLTQHSGGAQTGCSGEINGCLCVALAHQHTTAAGAQRHHVARPVEGGGSGVRVGEQPHGIGAVGGADSRIDALSSIDRHGVRGATDVLVAGHHGRKRQAVAVAVFHAHADVAGAVAHHEGHELWGGKLGGEDEVAFILAVFIVNDHNGLARGDVCDGAFDRVELDGV